MKKLTFAIVTIILIAGAAQALDFTRISSERAFRDFVADRTLVDAFGGTLVFAANGGIAGRQEARIVTGGWAWDRGALCHSTRLDGIEVEKDCKLLYIRGADIVMQERRGASSQQVWTLR